MPYSKWYLTIKDQYFLFQDTKLIHFLTATSIIYSFVIASNDLNVTIFTYFGHKVNNLTDEKIDV